MKAATSCTRAVEILASLQATDAALAFTADEIEELMGSGLAVEADPDIAARVGQLAPAVRDLTGAELDDPAILDKIAAAIAERDGKLKSDWHRFTTSDAKLATLERERATLRRAAALLRDPVERVPILGLVIGGRRVPRGALYRPCPTLGDELYAITQRGVDVRVQLGLRLQRFAAAPLKTFLKSYDKVTAKMQALSTEVATLNEHVGFIRKNPHQVVIGLVKAGMPAPNALEAYHKSMSVHGTPDLAVTCTRNAAAYGGPAGVAHRLKAAEHALLQAGFWPQAVVAGAAKTLLPYEPLAKGVERMRILVHQLETWNIPQGAYPIKLAARLMSAHGEPFDIVQRVRTAMAALAYTEAAAPARNFLPAIAVALASMVKTDGEVGPLVQRFREIERELAMQKLSWNQNAADHALECVACAGTPQEVVAVVRSLALELSRGAAPDQSQVAIAASFAKRFAF